MKIIGLTGGIGAGKSMVARILTTMDFPVFYSDKVGKSLMSSDTAVINKVKAVFGDQAYNNGELNRSYLAKEIFNDQSLKAKLNEIVHPAVRKAFDSWKKEQNAPLVFNEAAILFETGTYKNYDYNILVTAPQETRIQRVQDRDNISKDQVLERMNNQWPDDKKRKLCDFEIINDGNTLLVPQVEKVIKMISNH